MATLSRRTIIGNIDCEFCQHLLFDRSQMFERCRRYNLRAHAKTGRAYTAVRCIHYIVDNRKWVVEKQSRHFQFRFCPVCGYDYVERKKFDGKLYKAPFSINNVPKSVGDSDA